MRSKNRRRRLSHFPAQRPFLRWLDRPNACLRCGGTGNRTSLRLPGWELVFPRVHRNRQPNIDCESARARESSRVSARVTLRRLMIGTMLSLVVLFTHEYSHSQVSKSRKVQLAKFLSFCCFIQIGLLFGSVLIW